MPEALEAQFAACLTLAERERLGRMRQAADRRRGLVARAALRGLLAQRLKVAPAAVPLAVTAAGKPVLANFSGTPPLHFSVSHSGARVAVAFGPTPVGVDIEDASCDAAWPDAAALAAAWFEPEEARRVAADPAAFLSIWTAKESVLKARGDGLSERALRGFAVPAASPEPQPVRCVDPAGGLERLYVCALAVGTGYRASLAMLDEAVPPLLRLLPAEGLPAARLSS